MASNNHVVGDLNEVIDLGSFSNNRIANPAPIDCRAGSNLDIMFDYDNADLRHLEVPSCAHDKAEPVLTDVTTRMDNDPIANDCVRDRTSWTDGTILSDPNVRSNHGVGSNQRSSADDSPRSYYSSGIDRHAVRDLGEGMDRCTRRYTLCFE
jgi:hypothetical protein